MRLTAITALPLLPPPAGEVDILVLQRGHGLIFGLSFHHVAREHERTGETLTREHAKRMIAERPPWSRMFWNSPAAGAPCRALKARPRIYAGLRA